MSVILLIEVLAVYILLPILTITEVIIPICKNRPLFPLIDLIKKITEKLNKK